MEVCVAIPLLPKIKWILYETAAFWATWHNLRKFKLMTYLPVRRMFFACVLSKQTTSFVILNPVFNLYKFSTLALSFSLSNVYKFKI